MAGASSLLVSALLSSSFSGDKSIGTKFIDALFAGVSKEEVKKMLVSLGEAGLFGPNILLPAFDKKELEVETTADFLGTALKGDVGDTKTIMKKSGL
jgi:hypothetical protein